MGKREIKDKEASEGREPRLRLRMGPPFPRSESLGKLEGC